MISRQTACTLSISQKGIFCKINANCVKRFMVNIKLDNPGPVSYTNLTLTTNREVLISVVAV